MIADYAPKAEKFVFRKYWNDIFYKLSDEDAGKLIKAICRYSDGEEVTIADDNIIMPFVFMAKNIEGSTRAYLEKLKTSNQLEQG